MARKPRLDTRNGIYHIMARGNDGHLLFKKQEDFYKFSHLLNDSRDKDPHILLSYCLMPNHIHLLMETEEVPLSRILHRLLLKYSLYFNKKYDRSGHLFQNRFKAKPCKQENYLLRLLVYIHDNPRKAGLVSENFTYPYSSERIYQRSVATQSPVNNMRALAMIGPSPLAAWRAYHQFLNDTRSLQDETPYSSVIQYDAGPSFHPDEEIYLDQKPPEMSRFHETDFDFLTNVPLNQLCAMVAGIMGVDSYELRGRIKKARISRARCALIQIARKAGWRTTDLIDEFGFNSGTIAYHLGRYEKIFAPEERKKILANLRQITLTASEEEAETES